MDGEDVAMDAATEAFESVRHEVGLLRVAVERLAARNTDAPDYTETLATIHQNVLAIGRGIGTLSQSPGLAVTPEIIGNRIQQAIDGLQHSGRRALDGVRNDRPAVGGGAL